MKTPEAVKSDPEFVSGFELLKENFCAYLVFQPRKKTLQYVAFWLGKVLFKGNNFRPTKSKKNDSVEVMVELLGMITAPDCRLSRDQSYG